MNENKAAKNEESGSDKILISFYVSAQTLEKVEDLLFYLKKQLPMNKRRKLTKSTLYETSLRFLVEDFQINGEQSYASKEINELMKS